MSNPSKQKGTLAEVGVVKALQSAGWPHVERRALGGSQDRGDIAGLPGVVIEVKNCKTMALGAWLREAEVERRNDGAEYGVVWHKLRGTTDAAAWSVSMTGETFMRLLKDAGR